MSKYGLFDKIGENETEEEKARRKKLEEDNRNSSDKKGYFKKLFSRVSGK